MINDGTSQWKVTVENSTNYPFVVVDNYFNSAEEKAVWKELDFISSLPRENTKRAETTVVARYSDGTSKSKAFRYYLNEYYNDESISPILNHRYKVQKPEFHNYMHQCLPYGRSFAVTNRDSCLISYYEDNDHYDSHFDTFSWTQLIWFVREPRKFDGGDFNIDEPNISVKLKHNRSIFFPCCYLHSVSPVKFKEKVDEIGYGRYTITHFYFCVPTGTPDKPDDK